MSVKIELKFVLFILLASFDSEVMGSIVSAENYPQDFYVPSSGKRFGGVYYRSAEPTTECLTPAPSSKEAPGGGGVIASPNIGPPQPKTSESVAVPKQPSSNPPDNAQNIAASKLHALVQHIYAAQARVQLEVTEIKRAQAVATSAQKSLEEAANNVRVITAALQSGQQEVAAAAVRAQTAQMQLAAHDQLLFAARQKVDALSSQMVGLQAEDGVGSSKPSVNMQALLSQLKEPLPLNQTPTPIPAIDVGGGLDESKGAQGKMVETRGLFDSELDYKEASY